MNKILLGLLTFAVLFSACNDNSSKITTTSGIDVEFFVKGTGESVKDSTILLFNMRYLNAKGNQLFNTEINGGPVAMQYMDSVWKQSGLIYEALSACKVGDSISFEIPAQDLYNNTFKMPVPDTLDAKSNIKFFVSLKNAFNNQEYQAYQKEQYEIGLAKSKKASEAQVGIDIELINQHLIENNIEALSTESGLKYVITQKGEGENAKAGETVVAHYHGTLLDGTKFDSSIGKNPYEFMLGQGSVIKGWDEGFALLNKGSKATLYIPSALAYGAQARSSVIKANAILKFDVELVDIK